ncbi:hypothetical protein D3P08_00845 [Paenibacillus nanensis]|uniref:ABC transporter substrate-binding protein n=1 Tax=Paenibacillus nanensis TaxID=393251 RepID=A0A3A1VNQ8_9BACL|nr:ABC transporter substrate-binding protein [Paenibacillus nanensis]RIX60163.1 hypothetical protein D3P08_00845 [Paenibacillus nanensis]
MRVAEDYLRLRMACPGRQDGKPFAISMEEIANALYCTPRNAKLIVKKWVELEWVRFVPGRGRGHTSELAFLMDSAALVLREAQERAKEGDVQGAFEWLKTNEPLVSVRPQFLEWLIAYFGYKTDQTQGERVVETLRLPIYREIVSLDPANAFYSFDTHLVHQLFSRLVEYDAAASAYTKGLAYHWESNEDATEWTFYLYKGVLFHDGQELTAEDVRASLARLRNDPSMHGWLTDHIHSVEARSRYTVSMKLSKPNRRFLWYMSHSAASIVPSSYPSEPAGAQVPVGSGPYRVTDRRKGKVVLEKFSSYYGLSGIIDRIEIIIVPENEAEACFGTSPGVLTVVTGEFTVPVIPDYPLEQTVTGVETLVFNLRKGGVLQSPLFRRALVYGVDRKRMVGELGEPRAYPAAGFHMERAASAGDLMFRPDDAAESLRQSGYDGQALQLYTFARHVPDAEWLKRQYASIGVRVDVHIVPWAELIEPSTQEAADMILFEAVLSEGPGRMLEYLQSDSKFVRGALSEAIIRDIDDATNRLLADPSEQAEQRWKAAIDCILQESFASVFLVTKTVRTIYHPSLQGVRINTKGWVDFQTIWFKEA